MDCIGYVRELKALKHPVGVYFETESINTLKDDTEMALSFTATMAQEESHIKSNIMNASIDMRFSRGIFLTPALLGYDQDENGNLVINEEEAKIVRLIFFMYLYGYSISEIANTLSSLKCSTKRGNVEWSYSSVCQILQNERHCGDVVARKTYTPDYLTHKSIKNTGKKRKIIHRDHHESIISRDDWLAVQRKLENQKNGTISFLPVLHVIKEGFLTGYIPINPRWAGFRAADYYQAAEEVSKGFDGEKQTGQSGENESLSGYEIVRGAFFANSRDACVTISSLFMTFSSACVRKIVNSRYVEILFNPIRRKLAVRPAQKVDRHSIEWTRFSEDKSLPKRINGSAFLPAIFDVLCWDGNEVYRAHGIVKQDADYRVLIFDLEDAIVMIPTEKIRNENPDIEPINQINKKKTVAFPENWADSFGINYAAYSVGNKNDEKSLKLDEKGEPFKEYDLKITDEKKVKQEITDLMEELGKNGKV